jgi:hypothetical protein
MLRHHQHMVHRTTAKINVSTEKRRAKRRFGLTTYDAVTNLMSRLLLPRARSFPYQ